MGNTMPPREQIAAHLYDGAARRWIVDRIEEVHKLKDDRPLALPGMSPEIERARRERDRLTHIATKLPGQELMLTPGRYVVWAWGDGAVLLSREPHRLTVGDAGAVLHCGKNLPSVDAAGDPRRQGDLQPPASSAT